MLSSTNSQRTDSNTTQIPNALKKEMQEDKVIATDYIHPHSLHNGVPTGEIAVSDIGGKFSVDDVVLGALPIPASKVTDGSRNHTF